MSKKNKEDSAQAFRYDFTPAEFKTFLFHSKKCPECSGPLTKEKTYEMREGQEFNDGSDPFFVGNARVKHFLYLFHCQKCGRTFTLQQLMEKR